MHLSRDYKACLQQAWKDRTNKNQKRKEDEKNETLQNRTAELGKRVGLLTLLVGLTLGVVALALAVALAAMPTACRNRAAADGDARTKYALRDALLRKGLDEHHQEHHQLDGGAC